MLGCVRIATVRQIASVITAEDADGRSYMRRAMKQLAELGLAETNGKAGRHPIWNLTRAGQKALADGNELPPRPKAGTGAKAVKAAVADDDLRASIIAAQKRINELAERIAVPTTRSDA
jgi:hypothetical protein